MDQAFLCLWNAYLEKSLSSTGVTDACFSNSTQTQLVLDIKTGLNIAFSQPGLSPTASQSLNEMAAGFQCLDKSMQNFTELTSEIVIANTKTCFPLKDSTSKLIVSSVIASFGLLDVEDSSS